VLKELQTDGKPQPGMHLEILKAKWEHFVNSFLTWRSEKSIWHLPPLKYIYLCKALDNSFVWRVS
jgi:hypothetical protein